MHDHQHTLYARGQFRVAVVSGRIAGAGYLVLNASGAPVLLESTLHAARDWVDRQVGGPSPVVSVFRPAAMRR